jgi:predicted negative regulator of RcsB-dependent stress response
MYDLEEQEQLDALKAWWKQHGKTVIIAAALGIAVAAGIQGWRHYQKTQTANAAGLYQGLQDALQMRDLKKVRDAAGQLMEKYPSTPYAARAAMIASAANSSNGDEKSAKAQLQWVVEHAKESQLQDTARLRLAGLMLQEKQYDEVGTLLAAKHDAAFDGLYADLKGDVLSAQGKSEEAKKAYRTALEKLDQKGEYRNLVQMKLDALGG